MLRTPTLSEEQRSACERDGFVVLRAAFERDEMDRIAGWTREMDFVPCPTEPGDLAFFDCFDPQASEANLSDNIRRLYFATYNRLTEGDHLAPYDADKRLTYPPDIERDPDQEYVYRV